MRSEPNAFTHSDTKRESLKMKWYATTSTGEEVEIVKLRGPISEIDIDSSTLSVTGKAPGRILTSRDIQVLLCGQPAGFITNLRIDVAVDKPVVASLDILVGGFKP